MNTNVKAQSAITADIFGSTLTLTFANGKDLSVNIETLAPEIAKIGLLHGLKQKLVDAAAISRNTETGRSATIDDKYDAVKEVFDRLTSATPSWNKVRGEGNGPSGARNLLVRALMQLKGKSREVIEAFVEARTKEELAALRLNPAVADVIRAMKAAANPDVNTDDLLGELDDEPATDTANSEPEYEEQPLKKGRGRARVVSE